MEEGEENGSASPWYLSHTIKSRTYMQPVGRHCSIAVAAFRQRQ